MNTSHELRQKIIVPLSIWGILVLCSSFYIYSFQFRVLSLSFLVTICIQVAFTIGISGIQIKYGVTSWTSLIQLTLYCMLCWTFKNAVIILTIGVLPLIIADSYFHLQTNKAKMMLVIAIPTVLSFGLVFYYYKYNVFLAFDSVALFSGIIIYYANLVTRLMEINQKNLFLSKQMDYAYKQVEKLITNRERKKYNQLLHDTVTQDLIAIKMQLELILQEIPRPITDDSYRQLIKLHEVVSDSLKRTRKQILQHHDQLEDNDVNETTRIFEPLIFSFNSKFDLHINSSIESLLLNDDVAVSLTQVVTEALNNVSRHSNSNIANFSVHKSDKKLIITISDFGDGFDTSKIDSSKHFGLSGIKETIRKFAGHVIVHSSIGEGTSVEVSVPLEVAIYHD